MILDNMERDIPMDLTADESRPAPSSSYAVGNYELFKMEIKKVQLLLESAYKDNAMLEHEMDVNKGSLSSENDIIAGEASSYFSNRAQSIGYNTICVLMRSMHQLQSAVLHRYPEQRHMLGPLISYGEVSSVFASAASFDRSVSSESGDSSFPDEAQILNGDNHLHTDEAESTLCEPELAQEASAPTTDELNATSASTDVSCVSTISHENDGESTSAVRENIQSEVALAPQISANQNSSESSPMEVQPIPVQLTMEETLTPIETNPDPVPERRKRGRPKKIKPAPAPETLLAVDPIYDNQNSSQLPTTAENARVNNPNVMLVNCLAGHEKLLVCPKLGWNRSSVQMKKLGPRLLKLLKRYQYAILTESGQILPGNRELVARINALNRENASKPEVLISIPDEQETGFEAKKSNEETQQSEPQASEVPAVLEAQKSESMKEKPRERTTEEDLENILNKLKRINKNAGRLIVRRPKPQPRKPPAPAVKKQKTSVKGNELPGYSLMDWIEMDEDAITEMEAYNSELEKVESPVPVPTDVTPDPMDFSLHRSVVRPFPVMEEEDLPDLDEVKGNDEERLRQLVLNFCKEKKSEENPAAIVQPTDVPVKKGPKTYTPMLSLSSSDSDSDTMDDSTKVCSKKAKKVQFSASKDHVDETTKNPDEANASGGANTINDMQQIEIIACDLSSEDSGDDCVVVDHIPPKKNITNAAQRARQISRADNPHGMPALVAQLLKQRAAPPVPYKKSKPLPSVTFLAEMPAPPSSKGRREIRPIKEELTVETQQAEREEQQRLLALEESQKLQEELASEATQRGLVLEFDVTTKDPLIAVEKCLSDALKPHQEDGVRFLWSSCFGSVAAPTESGCVLAHLMGLGKSLQALTLVHTALSYQEMSGVRSAVILCPMGIVPNWKRECERWLGNADYKVPVYTLSSSKAGVDLQQLMYWDSTGGIGILHYNAAAACFRVTKSHRRQKRNSMDTEEQKAAQIKPATAVEAERIQMEKILTKAGILVCDEGHLLKNPRTGFSRAVNKFKTQRRIILSGTPLQNNLVEYYHMVNLVKPNLLGSLKGFANGFINPINNGMHNDSLDTDVQLMKRRTYVLNEKLRGCVQRKDYGVLEQYLKPKHEFAILINLSDLQNNLYREYLNIHCAHGHKGKGLLKDYNILQRICVHPKLLYSSRYSSKNLQTQGRAKAAADEDDEDEEEYCFEDGSNEKWFDSIIPPSFRDTLNDEWGHSGKLVLLKEIVQACSERGEKLLVFSRFTYALNVIEEFLQQHCPGNWKPGYTYFRIDGSIKPVVRDKLCAEFNTSPNAKLFLLTQKAGGLGFNLHGANRVVLFDVSFNPSDDAQSVFRSYRMGQEKECFIYRFVSHGGMEEKTYVRSVMKLSLARRVVDEQQVVRPFVFQDSYDMYVFNPSSCAKTKTAADLPIPNDELLKNLLLKQKHWVYNYVNPENLLENGLEADLNDAEKTYAITEVLTTKELKKPAEKKQPKQKAVPRLQHLPAFDHHCISGKSFNARLFEVMQIVNNRLSLAQIYSVLLQNENELKILTELSGIIREGTQSEAIVQSSEIQFDRIFRQLCEFVYLAKPGMPASSVIQGQASNPSTSNNSVLDQQRGTSISRGRGKGRRKSGGLLNGLPPRTYVRSSRPASAIAARRRSSQGENRVRK